MGYRAVALSQVYGSGAESIGRDVAQQLGFGYLNEAIVAQVASGRGVDPAVVSEAEQRKSFFSRLAEMAARAAALGLSDKEAARSVRQSDAARASYLKRVYDIGEESNTDYDVVINTERLTTDAAADLIIGLVQARAPGLGDGRPSRGTAGR
jgi:cytidylate kinase